MAKRPVEIEDDLDDLQAVDVSNDVLAQMGRAKKAVDIAYYMSKNIGELIKATRAAPEERARIIGRLEGRFSATSAARKRRTGAPEPIGSNRKSSSPKGKDAKYGPSDQDAFDKAFYG